MAIIATLDPREVVIGMGLQLLDVTWWRWVGFIPVLPALCYAWWAVSQMKYDWLDKDDELARRMGRLLHAGACFQFAIAFFLLWMMTDASSISGAIALVGMGTYLLIWSWMKRPTRVSRALGGALLSAHRRRMSTRR